jgi:hypothetical protein
MSKLEPLAALTQASPEARMQQRSLRLTMLARMLSELRAASSLESALVALSSHAEMLLVLGRHDGAARLCAFARAVGADVGRLRREAAELDVLLEQRGERADQPR